MMTTVCGISVSAEFITSLRRSSYTSVMTTMADGAPAVQDIQILNFYRRSEHVIKVVSSFQLHSITLLASQYHPSRCSWCHPSRSTWCLCSITLQDLHGVFVVSPFQLHSITLLASQYHPSRCSWCHPSRSTWCLCSITLQDLHGVFVVSPFQLHSITLLASQYHTLQDVHGVTLLASWCRTSGSSWCHHSRDAVASR